MGWQRVGVDARKGDSVKPDDEDDSMAANPEEPRTEIGYEAATAPRGRRIPSGPTHWAVVEREGAAPMAASSAARNFCAAPPLGCGDPVDMLHATGTEPRRRVCGRCQGKINRDRIGWAKAAEPKEQRR